MRTDARWDLCDVADAAARALRTASERLDLEQATRGVDALGEVALHALLAEGLAGAGFGVHREQRYPSRAQAARKRSSGERCDVVLTESCDRPLEDPASAWTLFQGAGVPPEEALWLEVKHARQFGLVGGVASVDPNYSATLLGPAMSDVVKLAGEAMVRHAAVLLVMQNADEATAEHDLLAWVNRCLDKGLPVGAPVARRWPIADRLGNGVCSVAVVPVR